MPCQHHTVAGAARTPVESTVVVYDGSNWRHKLIRPIGGCPGASLSARSNATLWSRCRRSEGRKDSLTGVLIMS